MKNTVAKNNEDSYLPILISQDRIALQVARKFNAALKG